MTRNTGAADVPAAVQLARSVLALVAISHVTIPIVMWLRRDDLAAEISSANPGFGPAELDTAVNIALRSAALFHAVLLVFTVLLVVKLVTGRPWVRRLTTISQALAVLFSAVSWSSSTMFHAVIPPLDILQLLAIGLLWVPQRSRAFFGHHASRAPNDIPDNVPAELDR
jgi:hypothetical protein